MCSIIEYLKDPHLVLKIQRFYGIRSVDSPDRNCTCITNEKECQCCSTKCDKNLAESVYRNCAILRRNKTSATITSDQEDILSSESDTEANNYVVTNLFWYYVFIFGTELGDEIFYATFIPFWFWNVDGAVGRRVVMVWTIIMYIGQGIKDVVCWPRPACPPVYRLQKKWAQEYGMPSTHAMVGVSIPFSVVLYTINRYQYPIVVGLAIAVVWCTVMCVSRLYLGMHSVLDIVAGLILALFLMIPLVPLVDSLDYILLTNKWSPLALIVVSIASVVFYPKGKGDVTPTRGDTTLVISVCAGVLIGAWTNYQLGEMEQPSTKPPYSVIWPSYNMLGLSVLRTVLGLCCIVATRAVCKSVSYAVMCYVTASMTSKFSQLNCTDNENEKNDARTQRTNVSNDSKQVGILMDLCRKYFTYIVLGFMIMYLLPKVFRMLRIERPTFYTEI